MIVSKPVFIGVDLFAGAGGLSLGAMMAGVDVVLAIEKERYAASTYAFNHPKTKVITDDIRNVRSINIDIPQGAVKILLGGPPCQGYSYSNQKTRNRNNPDNWLLHEFIRLMKTWMPDWVVFENVSGFINTEKGLYLSVLLDGLDQEGYSSTWSVLNAREFGIPQRRARFFLIASKRGGKANFPDTKCNGLVTVNQAISDLPSLPNGASKDYLGYTSNVISEYAALLRGNLQGCKGHLVTNNSALVVERYKHVPPGGNWENIPEYLMRNYLDRTRCHTGIYYRLKEEEPALTIGNYRKAMLIHPWENRGLSVREAARIQSFPDSYEFVGSIGFQQQQVGNAVPPLLAKAVISTITNGEIGV